MKNLLVIFLVIFSVFLKVSSAQGTLKQCPDYQIHFEKILGYRPPLPLPLHNVKILHKSYQVIPSVINLHCMELCRNDHNCDSYVLSFNTSECYGFTSNDRIPDNLNYRRADDNELVEDIGVVYFVKTCLNIPQNCKSTLWPLLRIPGASLIGRGYLTINKLLTRRECIERCLFETSFKCRSVSFQISQRNNLQRMGLANILNKDIMGRCIMSRDDKNMEPDSFRVAPLTDEYIENNCQVVTNGANEQFLDDLCAYEHFPGSVLMYAEHLYIGLTDRQCQEKCFKENKFFCKGITYQRMDRVDHSRCFIHSEDIMSLGPRAVIAMPDAYYLKRVQCLNLNVRCTQTHMIIRYNPRNYFQGRIYTENHPDDCGVSGSTHGPTFLTLPIGLQESEQQCGISRAFDYESPNRTLIYTYIIIQNNPLVQMQSDRYIKIGCISHFNRIFTSAMPDVSLEASVTFNGKDYDGIGSLVIDKNFECPKMNIFIVDPFTDEIVKEARIGQILKFIISMDSDHYDLRAINLTATTDYERLELINANGCPVNPSIFPALQPEKSFASRRLMTKFKAFKFASSPQVKFTVIIQFCHGDCVPINCGYGIISHGRKKRQISASIVNKSPSMPSLDRIIFPDETSTKSPPSLEPVKFPEPPEKLIGVRVDSFGNPQGIQQYFGGIRDNDNEVPDDDIINNNIITIPLNITLKVLESDANDDGNDRFVVGENDQILYGSLSSSSSSFCLDESLVIAIIIFWLIFQVLLIFGCCIMINRYRKMSEYDDDRSINNSSGLFYPDSLDNRHVRWADQRSIHDTYFQ